MAVVPQLIGRLNEASGLLSQHQQLTLCCSGAALSQLFCKVDDLFEEILVAPKVDFMALSMALLKWDSQNPPFWRFWSFDASMRKEGPLAEISMELRAFQKLLAKQRALRDIVPLAFGDVGV